VRSHHREAIGRAESWADGNTPRRRSKGQS
jgi:hypothetical protein